MSRLGLQDDERGSVRLAGVLLCRAQVIRAGAGPVGPGKVALDVGILLLRAMGHLDNTASEPLGAAEKYVRTKRPRASASVLKSCTFLHSVTPCCPCSHLEALCVAALGRELPTLLWQICVVCLWSGQLRGPAVPRASAALTLVRRVLGPLDGRLWRLCPCWS